MPCEELDRTLDALLDGESPPTGRVEVNDHLAGCARCRQRHGPLLAWLDALARGPRIPLPGRLRVPPTPRPAPRTRRLAQRAAAAAAAIVLLVAGAMIVRSLRVAGSGYGPDPDAHPGSETPTLSAPLDRLGALQRVRPLHLVRREIHERHLPSALVRSEFRVAIAPAALGLDDLEQENRQP